MLRFQNFIKRYFRGGCTYEIVVDILSQLVFILDKTGDHLPVKAGHLPT